MTIKRAIHWFRQDLRLSDNPALSLSAKSSCVYPIYILDDFNSAEYFMGAASRLWLYHSLKSLDYSLDGNLSIYRGNPIDILCDIIKRFGVDAVYWNRCYEPWRINRDAAIKKQLNGLGVCVESANSSLLWEPWKVNKKDGGHYKVFTPFYLKGCLQAEQPRIPLPSPKNIKYFKDDECSLNIDQLELIPTIRWDKRLLKYWEIGEKVANARFQNFIRQELYNYKEGRNYPSMGTVSRLSPYLHFGEISPNQLWYQLQHLKEEDENIEHFCSELAWREFSYSLLYYHPNLPMKNLQSKFDDFPWEKDQQLLEFWQQGQTGVPMVDAGMRELWQTGFMHNRVRMIVGSFLVKNLRLHWRYGEKWFWDTLFDADLANNSASWQWISGCGADATPYFRIFNPVTQGQKFDPDGSYVRQYIPEIAQLPNKYLFNPWQAPKDMLEQAGIELGKTYPKPIVDLKQSRENALRVFHTLKNLDFENK